MDMPCNARDMWFGEKIKYNLSNNDRKNLEMLLLEISPYKEFKEGQFEALCKMLNDSNNKICIMPTGSGKSLIYYMASLLQPLPVIVISPVIATFLLTFFPVSDEIIAVAIVMPALGPSFGTAPSGM